MSSSLYPMDHGPSLKRECTHEVGFFFFFLITRNPPTTITVDHLVKPRIHNTTHQHCVSDKDEEGIHVKRFGFLTCGHHYGAHEYHISPCTTHIERGKENPLKCHQPLSALFHYNQKEKEEGKKEGKREEEKKEEEENEGRQRAENECLQQAAGDDD